MPTPEPLKRRNVIDLLLRTKGLAELLEERQDARASEFARAQTGLFYDGLLCFLKGQNGWSKVKQEVVPIYRFVESIADEHQYDTGQRKHYSI